MSSEGIPCKQGTGQGILPINGRLRLSGAPSLERDIDCQCTALQLANLQISYDRPQPIP